VIENKNKFQAKRLNGKERETQGIGGSGTYSFHLLH
jgi:hypothetical protein